MSRETAWVKRVGKRVGKYVGNTCGEVCGLNVWVSSFDAIAKTPYFTSYYDYKRVMAEEQGFEPWEDFHPRRFSRPVHSTTLPLLRPVLHSGAKLIYQE